LEPRAVDKALGPGETLQGYLGTAGKIVRTIICGDNCFSDRQEESLAALLGMVREAEAFKDWMRQRFPDRGLHEFGIGVGTLVLAVNVVLLSSYTLGCHSLRHLVGGVKDEVSTSPVRHACYNCSSSLNGRHMLFAWLSLFSVALSDVYVRLCSMGILMDVRLF